MSPRRHKLERVRVWREQTLNDRANLLIQQREARDEAAREAARESQRLLSATERRNALLEAPIDVCTWMESEQWMLHRNRAHSRAEHHLAEAETRVDEAHQAVVEAHVEVKCIELLTDRLDEGARRSELRTEQKLSDDLVQRRYGLRRRSPSD